MDLRKKSIGPATAVDIKAQLAKSMTKVRVEYNALDDLERILPEYRGKNIPYDQAIKLINEHFRTH